MDNIEIPKHEKIFNEICTKLNELSQSEETKTSKDRVAQLEKMQNQIKTFQYDLLATHENMQLKIQTLEKMTTSNSDLTIRVQELTDLLNQERNHNSKLSTDLAKSLDLSLKLQLEVQEIKARALQAQIEERKQFQNTFDNMQMRLNREKSDVIYANEELIKEIQVKDGQIDELNQKINDLEKGMSELESTSLEQGETIDHLMNVAENKIVELKLSCDRKSTDLENALGELNQVKTQIELFKNENYALKDYINKMTEYQKQVQVQHAQQLQQAQQMHQTQQQSFSNFQPGARPS